MGPKEELFSPRASERLEMGRNSLTPMAQALSPERTKEFKVGDKAFALQGQEEDYCKRFHPFHPLSRRG